MFLLQLSIFVVAAFTPGFALVRRFRWSPMEKLCGSIGFSMVLLYLVAWGTFCWSPREQSGDVAWVAVQIGTGAAAVALALLCRRDVARLLRVLRVRRGLAGYGFLLLWALVVLAMIRHYSGLGWGADWLGHFHRALFILHRFPPHSPLLGDDSFPARPPMMNAIVAFAMTPARDSFAYFQVISTALNLLLFLPCWMMIPACGLTRKARLLPLLAVFAFNPVIIENATYSWTKSFACFFVILSLWFYLAALRKRDSGRMIAAFVFAGAGLLCHYLGGPYLVFLTAHYVIAVFWKRPRKWSEVVLVGGCGAALLATWFAWSIANFGTHTTVASNTSVVSTEKYEGNRFAKIGWNVIDSIVPYVVRGGFAYMNQPNAGGRIRDNAFGFYQVNLIFSMGLVGGPLVLWLLYRYIRRGGPRLPDWPVWRVLVPAVVLIGLAVVGERDVFGTAHLTLIPIEALGLTLIAASFPWKRSVALTLLAGCSIDFALGIYLQGRMQSLENGPGAEVFTVAVNPVAARLQPGPPEPDSLSVAAWENWFWKHRFELDRQYLTLLATYNQPGTDLEPLRRSLEDDLRDDGTVWHGWWVRHDFHLDFLGDDLAAAGAVFPPFLLLMFAGLTLAVLRESWPKQVRIVKKAVPRRRPRGTAAMTMLRIQSQLVKSVVFFILSAAVVRATDIPRTLVSEDESEPIHSAISRKEAWTVDSVRRIRAEAEKRMKEGPWTVTSERPVGITPEPDSHDYFSEAPYWWPNPDNPTATFRSQRWPGEP